ncbi:MAG: hypothetical protein MK198_13300 [Gracilimonas sp.]|uniref:hypothetical protein n=1 Tax=Gracilimonas sp. TaxID=1974203 RepID=UPI00375359F3|nr:hypothetical protein [Gracilimonas sp.]
MISKKFVLLLFKNFFNENIKERIENITLYVATIGFLVHLTAVFLQMSGLISVHVEIQGFLSNPISALYTPFSFILFYEVYLLIYYLPRSFSVSIAKQYEIVSLILIRRIFKDISYLDFENIELFSAENLTLIYDIAGFLVLFFLIFLFRYLLVNRKSHTVTPNIEGFILYKKILCIILVPVFLFLSIYSFVNWIIELNQLSLGVITTIRDFNKIFYNEFFVALIIVDVLILIASFRYTDRYSLLIRNTGFVVTTVLIRVSFSTDGLTNVLLLISGVAFGVIILYFYSLYDKIDKGESTKESYAYL